MKTILVEYPGGEVKLYEYPSLKALKNLFKSKNIKYVSMKIDWGWK